ncbi:acid protease [Macrolepiota fuliginosa MF-IS2]|uniref:Acid protease n=1 Tax=Macrolepiota fuliginosa MF-IS2 TaxID=1400762 RepID=A0A9P5XGE6_9AGAR|nr:acid protease [Macrolepiota fuliginosa MF-IS2]
MRLSLVFAALLAAVPTLATVIPSRIGTVIPLTKRTNLLVDDQGIVKPEVLKGQINKVASKFDRGFRAFEKNTGQVHPGRVQKETVEARATGAVPLVDDQDALWHGTISVGTPAKQFTVDFDTGSSDLFLPGPDCGATCQGHQVYNTAASTTAKDQGQKFSLAFGDGSTVQGEVFTDTVAIAGLTANNQAVGAATQYSTGFESNQFPPDGLMGMAFRQISVFGDNPFFQTLIAQGTPTASQFSFKLSQSGSELFLGGVNNNMFTGSFTNVPVTQEGFWQVTLGAVNVGGSAAISNQQAAIDTGTTLIVAPQAQVAQFYQAIPGSQDASQTVGAGFFTFPCSANPSVSLTFGGKEFAIPSASFNLGQVSAGSSQCVGGIAGTTNIDLWVVGDLFLTNVYTTFDAGNSQVGFATLA